MSDVHALAGAYALDALSDIERAAFARPDANPAGVLPAGATGATRLIEGVRGMDVLGVTIEPAGGSRTPTVPTVAGVPLT